MLKVILIDDEEMALDVLEILLLEIGGISVAGKFMLVSEALNQASDLKPDLILLDIEMPGTNGLAAADLLIGCFPGAEIIFVTAHNQYALEAFETNAIGYLLKPVAKERLIKALSRYVGLHTRSRNRMGLFQTDSTVAIGAGSGELKCKPLQLKALGSLELYEATGRLITWRTKKTKELFAYLWCVGGAPVYRYRILDELWPDIDTERSQALFHTTLYNLRIMLRTAGFPDMVAFGDERYWMQTESIVSDVALLEALMGGVYQQNTHRELLSLYRGGFLEMEHYSWAESKRYELHSAYIRYLNQTSKEVTGAVMEQLLRKLIELEPYQEEYYDRLLLYLKDSGDTAGVDKLSELKRQAFEQELGFDN
jgi:two-component system LytT family response regulator